MDKSVGDRVRSRAHEVFGDSYQQADLARLIEMKPDALSRSLNGKRSFAAIELSMLADQLSTSMHWLLTGESDPNSVRVAARHAFDHVSGIHENVQWSDVKGTLNDIALAYRQIYALDDAALPESQDVPDNPNAVRQLLLRNSRGGFVRHFAENVERCFDVGVIRMPGIKSGFSLETNGRYAIVVNETGNWFYQNWSIAHELGHVALKRMTALSESHDDDHFHEQAANAFAADLLMPAEVLRAIDWREATPAKLAQFVWEQGISTQVLRIRMSKLRVPTSREIDAALQLKTQNLLRNHWAGVADADSVDLISERMEEASIRRFPKALVAGHLDAVRSGRLHAGTLAWLLGVEVSDLEDELQPDESAADDDIEWFERNFGIAGAENS